MLNPEKSLEKKGKTLKKPRKFLATKKARQSNKNKEKKIRVGEPPRDSLGNGPLSETPRCP